MRNHSLRPFLFPSRYPFPLRTLCLPFSLFLSWPLAAFLRILPAFCFVSPISDRSSPHLFLPFFPLSSFVRLQRVLVIQIKNVYSSWKKVMRPVFASLFSFLT